jgi:hypothetical protein
MNALLFEMRRSLEELQLGLDGALNMSDKMEALARGIATNSVPMLWMSCMSTRVQVGGSSGGAREGREGRTGQCSAAWGRTGQGRGEGGEASGWALSRCQGLRVQGWGVLH